MKRTSNANNFFFKSGLKRTAKQAAFSNVLTQMKMTVRNPGQEKTPSAKLKSRLDFFYSVTQFKYSGVNNF